MQSDELVCGSPPGVSPITGSHHLEVGDRDFYLDLLFYHLKLRAGRRGQL